MTLIADYEYHGVVIDSITTDIISWMTDKLGPNGERWFVKSSFGETTIYFKNQRDHTLFLLTWGK